MIEGRGEMWLGGLWARPRSGRLCVLWRMMVGLERGLRDRKDEALLISLGIANVGNKCWERNSRGLLFGAGDTGLPLVLAISAGGTSGGSIATGADILRERKSQEIFSPTRNG